ncbi:MAG: DUF6148 family protein [Rhodospirillaceae bacterium]
MAGLTLAQAETELAAWLAADAAVAGNQSYRIGDRELRRADAAEIRRNIDYWDGKVKALTARASGRARTRYVVTG